MFQTVSMHSTSRFVPTEDTIPTDWPVLSAVYHTSSHRMPSLECCLSHLILTDCPVLSAVYHISSPQIDQFWVLFITPNPHRLTSLEWCLSHLIPTDWTVLSAVYQTSSLPRCPVLSEVYHTSSPQIDQSWVLFITHHLSQDVQSWVLFITPDPHRLNSLECCLSHIISPKMPSLECCLSHLLPPDWPVLSAVYHTSSHRMPSLECSSSDPIPRSIVLSVVHQTPSLPA